MYRESASEATVAELARFQWMPDYTEEININKM
jgi:hypothetical protein